MSRSLLFHELNTEENIRHRRDLHRSRLELAQDLSFYTRTTDGEKPIHLMIMWDLPYRAVYIHVMCTYVGDAAKRFIQQLHFRVEEGVPSSTSGACHRRRKGRSLREAEMDGGSAALMDERLLAPAATGVTEV